jgi:glycosyltransferase involved in cell wall biosynthesis
VRILTLAYACEPHKGSEPGAGWTWARMLGQLGDTWVITRANNREAIEAELPNTPERDRLHFVFVDLPPWAHRWKRRRRGIHLYYLLWQLAALRPALRLQNELSFDLVWHLTLSSVWFGSVGALVGAPFLYGPMGGGATAPWRLLPSLGPRGACAEVVRDAVQSAGRYLNPLARISWRRAVLILVQNHETRRWLPRRHQTKAQVFPNVVLEPVPSGPSPRAGGRPRTAMFAGELVPLKGAALAIRAMALLPEWRLLVVGAGPDEARLRRVAVRFDVERRVQFIGQVPRSRLLHLLGEEADVVLFPSLRDQAGWVVAEALACGVPVVCLDRGGPPLLGGRAVPPSSPARTVAALAQQVLDCRAQPPSFQVFDMASRQQRLADVLRSNGLLPQGTADSGSSLPVALGRKFGTRRGP